MEAKKVANDRSNDFRKKGKHARRDAGLLPIRGDYYIKRYLRPDVLSCDFDVLNYDAVKGGDTGKHRKKDCKANMTWETAEVEEV